MGTIYFLINMYISHLVIRFINKNKKKPDDVTCNKLWFQHTSYLFILYFLVNKINHNQ